jgi:murein DD-endopeptidase MepM/ murein hydrolase activator NlpD
VVVLGWSQYGYGNVVQIDHGNGFATVYAHLGQINVGQCQAVYGGQIGMAGSTGNSTKATCTSRSGRAELTLNPWSIVQ